MPERRRVRVEEPGKKRVAVPEFGGRPDPNPAPHAEPQEAAQALESCDCPRLDHEEWHEVESDWSDITFLSGSINAALGVPLGYGNARDELVAQAKKLGLTVPPDAMFLLGEGRFRRPVLLEVEGAPGGTRDVVRPGGVAFTRLLPAPLGAMKQALESTAELGQERFGRKPDQLWIWYLTCRVCSGEREYETLFIAHYREA